MAQVLRSLVPWNPAGSRQGPCGLQGPPVGRNPVDVCCRGCSSVATLRELGVERLMTTKYGQRASRKRRDNARWSNVQAAILTAVSVAVVVVMMMAAMVRHDRFLKERDGWMSSVPWDPSWPALPVLDVAGHLPIDVARAIYAFAGKKADVLPYIPCYCGCRMQGHRSNHDCYVRQRSADGRVTEWDSHGMTCPVGPDSTGDVTLWLTARADRCRRFARTSIRSSDGGVWLHRRRDRQIIGGRHVLRVTARRLNGGPAAGTLGKRPAARVPPVMRAKRE